MRGLGSFVCKMQKEGLIQAYGFKVFNTVDNWGSTLCKPSEKQQNAFQNYWPGRLKWEAFLYQFKG